MNIILCGMMGVGKTTVGIRISELTGLRWFDTDIAISDMYGKISDIFEYYGEARFRELETSVVKKISKEDGLVISTGGGLVLIPENSDALKKTGKIVFLRASIKTLLARVRADESRPLLKNTGKTAETLERLLTERTPVYEKVADYIVDTDGKSIDKIAREIIAYVKKADTESTKESEKESAK